MIQHLPQHVLGVAALLGCELRPQQSQRHREMHRHVPIVVACTAMVPRQRQKFSAGHDSRRRRCQRGDQLRDLLSVLAVAVQPVGGQEEQQLQRVVRGVLSGARLGGRCRCPGAPRACRCRGRCWLMVCVLLYAHPTRAGAALVERHRPRELPIQDRVDAWLLLAQPHRQRARRHRPRATTNREPAHP